MTTEPELLSCPFCGGANVKASGSMSWTYVWCADCKAQGPTVWHGGPTADKDTLNRCQSGAIAAWNRREAATALSEAKAENERLTRERDAFFDSLRQLICINSVLTALRSTAPLWLEHAERLIDERNGALNPKGGDNEA